MPEDPLQEDVEMPLGDYFEFGCPVKICAGHGSLEKIPGILSSLNARIPMILTDSGVAGAGLADIVVNALGEKISMGALETGVPPDSDLRVVNHLADVYRAKKCDSIIAVGGGSVLDTAKGINIVVSENAHDLMQFSGAGVLTRPLKPLLAIPTTAGTGSEVTQVAVIADHANNRKMLFSSYFLYPHVAILDERMTLTLPPAITASTGMDALSHGIEAYTCLAKNPLSDTSATSAVRMISENLLRVVKNPEDSQGRMALATAATLAGIAFSNSTPGLVHTMGHSVGSVCGVPHGTCMAIGLPYGLEYNLHKNSRYTAELLLPLAGPRCYAATPPGERAEKTILLIRQLNEDLHHATEGRHARCFGELKDKNGRGMVPRDRFERIAKTAMGDGTQFFNPEEMDVEDYLMVLEAAWEGVPLDQNRIRKGR
jgi:alcohol dehydrogenase